MDLLLKAGTGKTLIGTKIAKIWFAMGILKENASRNSGNVLEKYLDIENLTYIIIVVYVLIIGMSIYNMIKKTFGVIGLFVSLFIIVLLVIVVVIYNASYEVKINNSSVKDSNLISVVSREDFIAQYLGQTEAKTKALLDKNRGKVLFIDEAYSLCSGEQDMYGVEALGI